MPSSVQIWSKVCAPVGERLKSANKAGLTATLAYDAEGRLSQTHLGGKHTRLAYDGVDLVAEYDGEGSVLRRYVHGPGEDEPLVWYEGSGTTNKRWLYADHLGSIVATANGAGTSTATYSYGPYGEPNVITGSRFRYTGQQLMGQLNLYYYKARFYSPTLGRFLQTDPIGYADDMNLYAYVGNDPVNATDPTGEFVWFVPVVTGAVGAVAGGTGYVIGNQLTGNVFSWRNFGIAVGVGAVAGAAAPFTATTLTGATATGAFANVAQGGITAAANSSSYSGSQAVLDAVSGAAGGAIGGAFIRSVGYGTIGTALPGLVAGSNATRDLANNITTTNIARNVLGNTLTTAGGAISLPPGSSATRAATALVPTVASQSGK